MKKLLKESASGEIKISISGKSVKFLVTTIIKSDKMYLKFLPRTNADLEIIEKINNKDIIVKKLQNLCNLTLFGHQFKYAGGLGITSFEFYVPLFAVEDFIISNLLEIA